MNLKTRFDSNMTGMAGFTDNRSQSGDLSYDWQPFTDNKLSLFASGENYSALTQYANYFTAKGRYAVMPFSFLALAAGGSQYKDKLYPEADLTLHFLSYFRLNAAYDPGVETKTFKDLYFNDYYETPDYGIIFSEKTLSFREKLGCYFNDNSFCEVEVSQADYKNYIYRSEITGSEFVTLNNLTATDKYVTRGSFLFRFANKKMREKVQFTVNSDNDMPFVPQYVASLSYEYIFKSWSAALGYDYSSKILYALNNTATIPESGDLSLLVTKGITKDVELTLKLDNLLSQTIETQLDFIRKSPQAEAGVRARF